MHCTYICIKTRSSQMRSHNGFPSPAMSECENAAYMYLLFWAFDERNERMSFFRFWTQTRLFRSIKRQRHVSLVKVRRGFSRSALPCPQLSQCNERKLLASSIGWVANKPVFDVGHFSPGKVVFFLKKKSRMHQRKSLHWALLLEHWDVGQNFVRGTPPSECVTEGNWSRCLLFSVSIMELWGRGPKRTLDPTRKISVRSFVQTRLKLLCTNQDAQAFRGETFTLLTTDNHLLNWQCSPRNSNLFNSNRFYQPIPSLYRKNFVEKEVLSNLNSVRLRIGRIRNTGGGRSALQGRLNQRMELCASENLSLTGNVRSWCEREIIIGKNVTEPDNSFWGPNRP